MMRDRIIFEKAVVEFQTDYGPLRVIDDVSFAIKDGEFVAIVGPSGCGKTTMMNMVAGFVRPTSGKVLLDGKPILGPGQDRGVIFQDYGVFPWLTVEQNILFGMKLKSSKIASHERESFKDRYLKLMGLSDFAKAFPRTLSGGMRQRLAIARAYATRPDFLFMDEPFGALDSQTRSNMQNLLLEVLQSEGKTVMLITHSVDEAIYLSSKVLVVTARPARIKEIIEVPFPYPRNEELQETVQFTSLRARLRGLVMEEYDMQQRLSIKEG